MRKIIFFLSLFVLCACSMAEKKEMSVTVTNSLGFDRVNEMISLRKAKIDSVLQLKGNEHFVIVGEDGKQQPYQVVSNSKSLIFLTSVKADAVVSYTIKKGIPETFPDLVYGKFVPERKDDFAWENNRVAFRMYGTALEATGEISNGIDFWAKRTEKLVIDKWYSDEFAGIKTYHTDGGEGLDFYKVGRTLGLGAAAPFIDGKLVLGNNFTAYKIIEKGPLRITFQLQYAPFSIGEDSQVTETRTISLDAYSQLNKIVEQFQSTQSKFPVAIGLVLRNEKEKKTFHADKDGIIAYEEPENLKNGIICVGSIYPEGFSETLQSEGHLLGIAHYNKESEFTYYTGACWNKAGFKGLDEWTAYLKSEKAKIDQPLKVDIK